MSPLAERLSLRPAHWRGQAWLPNSPLRHIDGYRKALWRDVGLTQYVDQFEAAGVQDQAFRERSPFDDNAARGPGQAKGGMNDIGAVGETNGRRCLLRLRNQPVLAIWVAMLLKNTPDNAGLYTLLIA